MATARHASVKSGDVVLRVLTEQGQIRPHVNLFVGEDSVRWSGGLATPVGDGTEISILPAVSGGTGDSTRKETT